MPETPPHTCLMCSREDGEDGAWLTALDLEETEWACRDCIAYAVERTGCPTDEEPPHA